jgi:NADPH:quinone reductase-like Zn-dependent oxidoreductase
MNDWFADGAMAEYCITQPSSVAHKPPHLTHVEAASVPIGALMAWQGLFDRARLQAGERLLVHGGAGAVGIFAIQLARFRGARVTATASARNLAFVTGLGADQVIDYRAVRFEEHVSGMDVVFDTVGGDTPQRSWGVLNSGGRMITIAAERETTTDRRVQQAFFIVEPNHEQLIRIGDLLESGALHPVVDVKAAGFKTYAVINASGDPSEMVSRTTLACFTQAGIVPTTANAVLCELHRT